jgi:hypothetical protein
VAWHQGGRARLSCSDDAHRIHRRGADGPAHDQQLACGGARTARGGASSAFISRDLGALLAGDYLTSFGLDRCCEELAAVTALGREHDVPFELSALVEQMYQRALSRYGPADGELLAVALLEEAAGVRLRHGPP